jgi:hypothetical protein
LIWWVTKGIGYKTGGVQQGTVWFAGTDKQILVSMLLVGKWKEIGMGLV